MSFLLFLQLLIIVSVIGDPGTYLAASDSTNEISWNKGSKKLDVSPEKLYEAVSGYFEGLHRPASQNSLRSNNNGKEQKRDPQRILAQRIDNSQLLDSELGLARRRIQRGEWELSSMPLSRALRIADLTDKETVQAITDKLQKTKDPAELRTASPGAVESEVVNSIGMRLVPVSSGGFTMGNSLSEVRRVRAEWNVPENLVEPETPDHRVEISRPFLIGKYEVTVGQFKQFVAETGYHTVAETQGWGWGYDNEEKRWSKKSGLSWKNPGFRIYDDYPVVMICHVDAEAFCKWLSSKEGKRYGLPTEAQWEYAARGGKNGEKFSWGNDYPDGKKLNFADRTCEVAWADRTVNDSYGYLAPVGSYAANGFGLYDMAGNAWELCSDYFDPKEYKKIGAGGTADPQGPKTGKTRVARGGSWAFDACEARNAFRFGVDPRLCVDVSGFRVVTIPDSTDKALRTFSSGAKTNAGMSDEQANALFNRVKELVRDGKRLKASSLVDKIPDVQPTKNGAIEDVSGFVKNTLKTFIDQTKDKSFESFRNSLGMKMVRIPEGSFVMGSSEADIAWAMNVLVRGQPISLENEFPFHKIRISRPFFMSATSVTVEQFQAFVNDTGYITDAEEDKGGEVFDVKNSRFSKKDGSSWRNPGWVVEPDQPVTMISYNDAVAFCEWLSAKERSSYKLPTEAQWEYAARGGLPMTQFSWGDQLPDGRRANYADKNTDFEWRDRDIDDGHKNVAPVGSYEPNGFGLYDMSGNVLQWVRDFYGEDYYRFSPEIDPEGPGHGENRIMRGGDWTSGAVSLRCAFRGWARPDLALYNGGFRVVIDTDSPQRPFHFSENFLTQEWVPSPVQRDVAKAIAKEEELSVKRSGSDEKTSVAQDDEPLTHGVLIIEFSPKSDAKRFGLIKGDVIVEYDGVVGLSSEKLISLIARTRKERRKPVIKFVRDGYEYSIHVPPGSLGVSIMDTVLRGPFKSREDDEKRSPQNDHDNKGKRKDWT